LSFLDCHLDSQCMCVSKIQLYWPTIRLLALARNMQLNTWLDAHCGTQPRNGSTTSHWAEQQAFRPPLPESRATRGEGGGRALSLILQWIRASAVVRPSWCSSHRCGHLGDEGGRLEEAPRCGTVPVGSVGRVVRAREFVAGCDAGSGSGGMCWKLAATVALTDTCDAGGVHGRR
jgi:hypothetical protein